MKNDHELAILFEKYLHYGELMRNYSKHTLESYRSSFRVFLKETGATKLEQLDRKLIENFLFEGRAKRGWGSVTFRGYFKHLNCFIKWCIYKGLMEDENPMDKIEKPKLETRIPRRLTPEEAQRVLDASFHMKYAFRFEKYRNRAIIGIMIFAGLRRGEVINLKMNDVDLFARTIFVNQGKGSKDRVVPISARLKFILQDYIDERERLDRENLEFFTSIQSTRRFGTQCINYLMRRLRKRTKLNFSSHTLRHSFATLMLEGGCDIYTLSKMMGHSKITTTTIYLSVSNKQLARSIEMHMLN